MIRETYKGRQLKAVKGKTYGKSRITVNGTDCGEWLGTQADVIEWAKGTIDDVDSRPFEGRWNECWYAPGTYELNEHGHVTAPGGICSCDYCEKRRIQPCADIKVDGTCVCDHCMKPYLAEKSSLEAKADEEPTAEPEVAPTPTVVATEIAWRANSISRDDVVAQLPNGSKVTAFFLSDPDGIWGEGYGYIASIPGTRRAVHGEGRLESLDAVASDALERVEKALRRRNRAA